MKWLLAAFLLGITATVQAQAPAANAPASTTDASETAASGASPSSEPAAFELLIIAADDVKQLLQNQLDLQRYRTLTDLSDDELDRLLELAQTDVKNLVATLGYFSPLIQIERYTGSAGQRSVSIQVTVGEPVRIGQVQLQLIGPIASDAEAASQRQLIRESWSLPAGSRFTQSSWDAAKQQALRQLTTRRYPTGRISQTLADIDPETRQARLEITLDSGPAYQLGDLTITGLKRFDAVLVQRLARLPVAVAYDQSQLVAAQQRLTDSGFFDSAFVTIDTQSAPEAARVLVTVREARLQKITWGLGVSTDAGARVSTEHLHQQLPWLGWRALSKLSFDRATQSIGTELTSPPNASRWRWNTAVLLQNQQSGSFDVSSQRWRAGASQEGDHIDRGVYLQYDRADSATTDQAASVLAETISANYSFTLRNFDAVPFPSSGWAWGAELGGGTTLGNPKEPFVRILTRWQNFWPLGAGTRPDRRAGRLAFRAQAGAVLAKEGVSLPATQLFLAGGDNSVRGYGLREIGTDLSGEQISAGRYLAAGSLEWQRPITRNGQLTDWEGALFVDAGAVANHPADLQAQVGVGAGVRWKTPVGPLQIDLAYGVAVKKLRLHLNVGFSF